MMLHAAIMRVEREQTRLAGRAVAESADPHA